MGAGGVVRRMLQRLSADEHERHDAELQSSVEELGATPIVACPARHKVHVAGTLRTVTLRPHGGAPALEAELYDGTGCVTLVWLGRRRIAGVEPGRTLVVEGRLCQDDGRRVIFNPTYELRPSAERC